MNLKTTQACALNCSECCLPADPGVSGCFLACLLCLWTWLTGMWGCGQRETALSALWARAHSCLKSSKHWGLEQHRHSREVGPVYCDELNSYLSLPFFYCFPYSGQLLLAPVLRRLAGTRHLLATILPVRSWVKSALGSLWRCRLTQGGWGLAALTQWLRGVVLMSASLPAGWVLAADLSPKHLFTLHPLSAAGSRALCAELLELFLSSRLSRGRLRCRSRSVG